MAFVIRNLISNAVKFTKTNGNIRIFAETENAKIRIGIQDDGIGIKREDADKIFNTSIKFSTIGTNKERGTGLGLNICKEFIESHSGTINYKSIEGEGSTFFIEIPYTQPEE